MFEFCFPGYAWRPLHGPALYLSNKLYIRVAVLWGAFTVPCLFVGNSVCVLFFLLSKASASWPLRYISQSNSRFVLLFCEVLLLMPVCLRETALFFVVYSSSKVIPFFLYCPIHFAWCLLFYDILVISSVLLSQFALLLLFIHFI